MQELKETVAFSLGKNIETLCKRWGWSQNRLGEKLGLGKGAVYNYIAGNSEPSLERMAMLEFMTGISISRFIFEKLEESDFPENPIPKSEYPIGGGYFEKKG